MKNDEFDPFAGIEPRPQFVVNTGAAKLAKVPVTQLREAAATWRRLDRQAVAHREASGFFKWFMSPPNMSLHDCIDDLIDEVERLRDLILRA